MSSLDAFITEVQGDPIEVELYGRTWTFLPEIPSLAILIVKAAAEGKEYDALADDDIGLLRVMMTPQTQVEELLALGATPSALAILVQVIMGVYAGRTVEETLAEIRETENKTETETPAEPEKKEEKTQS